MWIGRLFIRWRHPMWHPNRISFDWYRLQPRLDALFSERTFICVLSLIVVEFEFWRQRHPGASRSFIVW